MAFHLFHINELYSNADGTIQFIELVGESNNQPFLAGHKIEVNDGATRHEYTFDSNLPSSSTLGKSVLLATQSFADLNLVTPDYIIPDGFLFLDGGTIKFPSDTVANDTVVYSELPTDGVLSINAGGSTATNSPTNFAGDSGSVPPIVPGTPGEDSLSGGEAGELITGLGGADTLSGGGGNDSIFGGEGNDSIAGGAGEDSLTGGDDDDVFALAAGGGVDRIADFTDGDLIRVTGLAATQPLSTGNGSTLTQNQVQLSSSGGVTTLFFGLDAVAGSDLSVTLTGAFSAGQLRAAGTDIGFNHAPIVANAIANQNATEDSAFNFVIPADAFADADAGDTLSYSATLDNGAALPAWLLFNAGTRTFSGTPLNEDVGSIEVKVTVLDGSLATNSDSFTLTVANSNDAPTITSGTTGSVAENAPVNTVVYTAVGNDVDVGTTLVYSVSGTDAALFDINSATGALTLKASANFEAKSSYSLNVVASDGIVGTPKAITVTVTDVDESVIHQVINGTAAANNLVGGTGNDTINGFAGNDTLDGGQGIDSMDGGDGGDIYFVRNAGDLVIETSALAAGGNDTVFAYFGGYVLTANVENGRILFAGTGGVAGNAANNTLFSGTGNNTLTGGLGQDTASYLLASSAISANLSVAGAQATGGSGSDTFVGIENLTGSAFNDTLTGSAAANILDGGAGIDVMTGGDGADTYLVREATDGVSETNAALAGGMDLVWSFLNSYTLGTNVENGRIMATGVAAITGNSLNNTLYAGIGNNILTADTGVDTLSYAYMGAGVTANLSTGTASGGSGADSFSGFENLTGSNFNDSITGDAGANILDGGLGVDTMVGGDGNDTYLIRNGGDIANEASATGGTSDIALVYFGGYTLTANVENGRIMAFTASNINGNGLNNLLIAGIHNNAINGGAGTDTVSYLFATAAVNASLTTGQVTGGSGTDALSNIENLTGSSFNDTLAGNGNNNTITGGTGADTMTGGAGADTFDYNSEAESGIVSGAWDRIEDFQTSQGDKIDLSGMDANTTIAGNQTFLTLTSGTAFNSSTTFTAANQLFFDTTAQVLYGNLDADAAAEFAIELVGVNALALTDLVG